MNLIERISNMTAASRIEKLEDTVTRRVIDHLVQSDPKLDFPKAGRAEEGEGFARIDRNGVVYYSKLAYKVLNPYFTSGVGLQFVKATNEDPTGVFFTEKCEATPSETFEAMKAYLFAYGVPRSELLVVPATIFPCTYEKTPENIAALEEVGAVLFHE